MTNNTDVIRFVPWLWEITPNDPTMHKCPSSQNILLTYFAASILTTLISLIMGSTPVMRFISCNMLGKSDSDSPYMCVVQFLFHIGAELIVAAITISGAGYEQDRMPTVIDLALFYISRPRMAWLFILCLYRLSPWQSMVAPTLVSETIMQLIGTFYLFRTMRFASILDYFQHPPSDRDAQAMYASAVVAFVFTMIPIVRLVLAVKEDKKKPEDGTYKILHEVLLYFIVCGFITMVARWVFLAGYVNLAGDTYCPPSLINQVVVWVLMNSAGFALGAAF